MKLHEVVISQRDINDEYKEYLSEHVLRKALSTDFKEYCERMVQYEDFEFNVMNYSSELITNDSDILHSLSDESIVYYYENISESFKVKIFISFNLNFIRQIYDTEGKHYVNKFDVKALSQVAKILNKYIVKTMINIGLLNKEKFKIRTIVASEKYDQLLDNIIGTFYIFNIMTNNISDTIKIGFATDDADKYLFNMLKRWSNVYYYWNKAK